MKQTLDELLRHPPVITDGAWGTELYRRGLTPGASTDMWNLSHPDLVLEVAQAYVETGCDIILTNTFGANRFILARHGYEERVADINRAGVEVSKKAATGRAHVFASVGPTGKMLLMGDVTDEEMREAYREQIEVLAGANPDGIVLETFVDLNEALIALEEAVKTELPVAVSMVFDSGKEKDRTMMGVAIPQAVRALSDAGADIIGANCGTGIDAYIPVFRKIRAESSLPVWIKPNAGLPEMVDGSSRYTTTAEEFSDAARILIEEGVSFIGGCCGTTPKFIKRLVRSKSEHEIQRPAKS